MHGNLVNGSMQSRIDLFALLVCQTAHSYSNHFPLALDILFQSLSIGYLEPLTSLSLIYYFLVFHESLKCGVQLQKLFLLIKNNFRVLYYVTCPTKPTTCSQLLGLLFARQGNMHFDKLTKTRTVDNLLGTVSVVCICLFSGFLPSACQIHQQRPAALDHKFHSLMEKSSKAKISKLVK